MPVTEVSPSECFTQWLITYFLACLVSITIVLITKIYLTYILWILKNIQNKTLPTSQAQLYHLLTLFSDCWPVRTGCLLKSSKPLRPKLPFSTIWPCACPMHLPPSSHLLKETSKSCRARYFGIQPHLFSQLTHTVCLESHRLNLPELCCSLLTILLCRFTSETRELQLKKCFNQIGLHASLWGLSPLLNVVGGASASWVLLPLGRWPWEVHRESTLCKPEQTNLHHCSTACTAVPALAAFDGGLCP